MIANETRKGRIIITVVLSFLLILSLLLTAAGIHGIRVFESSGFDTADVWTRTLALAGEAKQLYRKMISPALQRAGDEAAANSTETARRLLAEAWGAEESELEDSSEEQVWQLLAATYSWSQKKLGSSDRKALVAVGNMEELQEHLLSALASFAAGSTNASSGAAEAFLPEDRLLSAIPALESGDPAKLAQVFLASASESATVLDKDTALAFTRATGSDEASIAALRQWANGSIKALNAFLAEHASTVILLAVLLGIDTALLFFLLRQDGGWKVDFKWILILLIVDFLLVFQLLPLVWLLIRAFFPEGTFSLEIFRRLYSYPMNWQALTNTVIASAATMALGTFIAYPLAYLIGRTNLYGRKFFRSLFVMTYMVPPYVGAMAWLRLLNKNVGTINLILRSLLGLSVTEGPLNIYSLGGLIWVLTTFYFPYAFITISRAMEKMDPSLEEASRVSGAAPLRTVVKITLPMMTPSLIAGALLVFVCAASCYGIPSIIGAPGNVHTVTTRIIEYYGLGIKGINDATGLAVFLIIIALVILYISDFVIAKKQYVTVSGKSTRPAMVDLRRWRTPLTVMVGLFAVIAVAIPFATILTTSFKVDVGKSLLAEGNFTWSQWSTLWRGETLDCLKNSLLFATVAATVGMIISCVSSYLLQRTTIRGRKLPDFLITLGSGTPSVVIALGLIMTMRGQFGVDIYNTASIIIIAYLIKYLMMGMRTVSSAMSQVHASLEECSQISGASWLRTMTRITGPLILPSIAAGWFLIFIPCFYELSMTTLLYTGDTKTIGFQLYQYWTFTSQPQACAMAFGILLFVILLNFVLNRLTKGEFTI